MYVLTRSALQIEPLWAALIAPPRSGGDGFGSATPELEFAGQLAEEILGLAEETLGLANQLA
jgi:hypothetical protein